ncbi:MAG: tyrosine--tRNA ligase, partial [Acidimicrobiales bacterium]|nr:tyrosine--tRNA ligase [Acidimicrobiales bacterium]
ADALLDDLAARGLIHDTTDRGRLASRLDEGPLVVYAGFDPTADSLHVGNLVPLLLLRRFRDAGHDCIALAGGATGMIGDPSGRSEERNLLDEATLAANLAGIKPQLVQILGEGARFVDNYSWTRDVTLLDFLRDVGKHVTVNQMVAKESIRSRMEGTDGISYTEFTYTLLQAFDYLHLHEAHGCELQVGGSDQWGNITAGIDLIRRRTGHHVHGLTVPLITRADGQKFGKSVDGAVWLSAARTSPYRFYQYWMQIADADVERFLLQLTLLPVDEARHLAVAHAEAPHRREGQRALARALTTMLHGSVACTGAEEASAVLFGGATDQLAGAALDTVAAEVPTTHLSKAEVVGADLVDLLVATGLASSRGDARRSLDQRGISVNNAKVEPGFSPTEADLLDGRALLLRKGKSTYHLISLLSG